VKLCTTPRHPRVLFENLKEIFGRVAQMDDHGLLKLLGEGQLRPKCPLLR
jgi:hypothetical protein